MSIPAGTRLGPYLVDALIGSGGMGEVYRARDVRLGRTVAVKVLKSDRVDDPQFLGRFDREARAIAALNHPHICTIYDVGTEGGLPYIVIELIEGETLDRRIRRGAIPPLEATRIVRQIVSGLRAAHAKGIVHRDIKPSNVFLTTEGPVKITDFGLALVEPSYDPGATQAQTGLPIAAALTAPGSALGTAAYMSPEQARGESIDGRTDIFSVGAVLYEMLTGRPAFARATLASVFDAVLHESPATPSALTADVPPVLDRIVARALEKDPAARYQSMTELAADLQAVDSGGSGVAGFEAVPDLRQNADTGPRTAPQSAVVGATPVPGQKTGRFPPRNGRRQAVMGMSLVVLLAALAALPPVRRLAMDLWEGSREKHIAVLPFRNIGDDPSTAALRDGLMETLTSKLTALEQEQGSFWVVPASAVRGRNTQDPSQALRDFGVNVAVTGSVQRDGKAITLTINLIDTRSQRQTSSAILGDPDGNLYALQDAAVTELARLLALAGDPRAKATRPVDAAAYEAYLQGLGYVERYDVAGNLDTGIARLEQATSRDDRFALAFAALGEAYRKQYGLTKDAEWIRRSMDTCRHAIMLDSSLPAAHVTLGRVHESTGQRDLAMEEFRRTLELDARNADALQGIARVSEALGRLADAEANFKKAIAIRPRFWDSYNDLASFYRRQRRYREAEAQFRRILEIVPDNAAIYTNLGVVLFQIDDHAGSRAALTKSVQLSPSYAAYANLGNLYYSENQFSAAAGMYEKALALNDKDHRVWGSLGYAQYWAGDSRRAQATFERAAAMAEEQMKIQPSDARTLALLSFYYAKLNQRDAAVDRVQRALALAPDHADVAFQAAETYENLGARKEALQWVLQSMKLGRTAASVTRSPELKELIADPGFRPSP